MCVTLWQLLTPKCAWFESAFELLYKKKLLCLPSLPPASMFCLLPHEVCTWTKETRLLFLRVLDPGHGKNFFKQWFQLTRPVWSCQAFLHKNRDHDMTLNAGAFSKKGGRGRPHLNSACIPELCVTSESYKLTPRNSLFMIQNNPSIWVTIRAHE